MANFPGASHPTTPEKQLLRLIEDDKKDGRGKRVGSMAAKHFSLSLFSPGAWIGRFSFFKSRLKLFSGDGPAHLFDIKMINNFLFLGMLSLAVYFVLSFSFSMRNLKKMPNLELSPSQAIGETNVPDLAGLKRGVSYYAEKVMKRDWFKMGQRNVAPTKGPSDRALEAVKHLKLVGISWSDNPDVMIEDAKALRTFFVKRGQMIGDVKVEAIFKDRVILSVAGEDIELK